MAVAHGGRVAPHPCSLLRSTSETILPTARLPWVQTFNRGAWVANCAAATSRTTDGAVAANAAATTKWSRYKKSSDVPFPVAAAVKDGAAGEVRRLLVAGAAVNAAGQSGETSLSVAVSTSAVAAGQVVADLLGTDAHLPRRRAAVKSTPASGTPPLIRALNGRRWAVAAALLDANACVFGRIPTRRAGLFSMDPDRPPQSPAGLAARAGQAPLLDAIVRRWTAVAAASSRNLASWQEPPVAEGEGLSAGGGLMGRDGVGDVVIGLGAVGGARQRPPHSLWATVRSAIYGDPARQMTDDGHRPATLAAATGRTALMGSLVALEAASPPPTVPGNGPLDLVLDLAAVTGVADVVSWLCTHTRFPAPVLMAAVRASAGRAAAAHALTTFAALLPWVPSTEALCEANGDGNTALHLGAAVDNYLAVKVIVDRLQRKYPGDPLPGGLPLNAAGRTALQEAAAGGHAGVVYAIVAARPPADALLARDRSGRNAYHLAAAGGQSRTAALLGVLTLDDDQGRWRRGGAAPPRAFVGTTDGRMRRGALHAAAEGGHIATLDVLLPLEREGRGERGADGVSCGDVHGVTPLHLAGRAGADGAVAVLLAAGADVRATPRIDRDGDSVDGGRHGRQTPLHMAAAAAAQAAAGACGEGGGGSDCGVVGKGTSDDSEALAAWDPTVGALVAAGGEIDSKDSKWRTPAQVARRTWTEATGKGRDAAGRTEGGRLYKRLLPLLSS